MEGDGEAGSGGGRMEERDVHGLSKSSIAAFERCRRRLWLQVHRPELASASSGDDRIEAGHHVGAVVRDMTPDGVTVAAARLTDALAVTRRLVEAGSTAILEATFAADGVLVRIDLLESDGQGGWRIVEVKSSTEVKRHHHGDLATQVWGASLAGLKITSAAVRHVDRTFVLRREGDYAGAFVDVELLEEIKALISGRAAVVAETRVALAGGEPSTPIGSHCADPFECEFSEHCRSAAPPGPEWPVTVLPNGGGKRWLKAGFDDLLEVPPDQLTNPTHLKIHRATASGEIFHDAAGAAEAIGRWQHPRIWLDFETIAFALPRWVGVRAYEQVPFQFSAHVEQADGSIEHVEFLSLDGSDPRRACAEALALLPRTGAVVAYNAPFERGCLKRLAAAFPDLEGPLSSLAARLVDLLPVAKETWYHRDQRGSWSIKAVLPTVTDLSYDDLDVRNGTAAQSAYLEAIGGASPERVAELDSALRRYCARDTEAMIELARTLAGERG